MNRAASDAGSPRNAGNPACSSAVCKHPRSGPRPVSNIPSEVAAIPPARPRARLEWLDFFRGLAVLVMIETHVVNTFLAGSFREGSAFALLNYVNGLVAPSFLFIAGFVQGMERRKSPGKPINYARRFRRLLGIAALGYAIHLPIGELLQHRWADALRIGSQVNILQCLALGLALLLGVSWLAEKLSGSGTPRDTSAIRVHPWVSSLSWPVGVAFLAAAVIVAAPFVQGWTESPIAVRAWVNSSTGSLFPIFPWIGFVFLGALAGSWAARPVAERVAAMAGLAVAAWLCRGDTFSAVSPSFFFERAVWVLALASFCEWLARRPLPALVLYAGSHSLKFYVTHLAVITALAGAGIPLSAAGLPVTLALLVFVLTISFAVPPLLEVLPRLLRTRPSAAPNPVPIARDLANSAS